MDIIEETQIAHDEFVRAVQNAAAVAVEDVAEAKAAISKALDDFHVAARKVDDYIQEKLRKQIKELDQKGE